MYLIRSFLFNKVLNFVTVQHPTSEGQFYFVVLSQDWVDKTFLNGSVFLHKYLEIPVVKGVT